MGWARRRAGARPGRALFGQPSRQPAHARTGSLHERGEDLHDRAKRARREVGYLDGRPAGLRVLEDARPAEVVEVVSRALLVTSAEAEARDRAVDDSVGNVVRSDSEPCRDPRSEALEDDVSAACERLRQRELRLQVADDRLRPRAERRVPRRRRLAHRIAVRGLDVHDPRAEPEQLPACVRAREVAREIDDEDSIERLQAE